MKKTNFLILVILLVSSSSIAQSIVIGSGASIYVPAGADVCAGTHGNITGNIYGEGTQCDGPVPVELTIFTADVNEYKVILKWSTETEVDNYGFDVQRSVFGIQNSEWIKLGFVEGHGNSNSPKQYSFIDKNPVGGSKFQYRLKQIDTDGKFEYSDIVEVEIIPAEFILYQNYPNPFNPTTTIKYALPFESKVKIVLYNSLGERITELVDGLLSVGYQEAVWNAINVVSGVYIYTIEAVPTNETGTFTSVKKMMLLK